MSKLVIVLIVIATLVPIALFLVFGKTQDAPVVLPEELLQKTAKQEPQPGDSPQCAVCRQIESGESQAQCLKDFACS